LVLRSIDKIYKIGVENVIKDLVVTGIDEKTAVKLIEILGLNNPENSLGFLNESIFTMLEKFKSEIKAEDLESVNSLENIFSTLKKMKILNNFAFNPAITRGLDYYTGIVFESFVLDRMEFGSVCSGGRYDNLTGLYSKNIVTGIGASFGLDRIISLMESKNLLSKKQTKTDVVIFNLDDKLISEYQNIAINLRKEKINTEVIFDKQKIANQFKYTEKKAIKYALIAGEDEVKSGKYNLKNILKNEELKSLTLDEIVCTIKGKK